MAAQKLGDVAVGTLVKIDINGQPTQLQVLHQGNPDPSLYDASCDGTWVCLENIYTEREWNSSNDNDYKNSDVQTYLNGAFFKLIESDIRAVIKQVEIPVNRNLSCKIFLLSGYELGWDKNDDSFSPAEGAKLDYFQSGTSSAANQKRIAKYNGSADVWWTRSRVTTSSGRVWLVGSNGIYDNTWPDANFGVRPAFILPQDLYVMADGTITTNQPPTAPGSIEVSGVVSGGKATITLTAATDPDGTVESYIYERQVDGGAWQQVAQANSLTQTDQISEDWGTVAYRACAVDDMGVSGPYVTGETQTINSGWVTIGGPAEAMGSKPAPFAFDFAVSVSGVASTGAITVYAALDGEQVYSGTPSAGTQISIPIDTRLLGAGEHTIEVQASKDDYLPASKRYTFTIPAVTIPAGGTGEQAQGSDGRPVFHTTLAQRCIGRGGVDMQAQVDALTARVKTLEG